jgi:hypothetical protein
MNLKVLFPIFVILGSIFSLSASTIIDFEAQGDSKGDTFTGTPDSPLVIGVATFTGGELLFNESFALDETAVYATSSGEGSGYTNPLVINFSVPVSSFSIDVGNGDLDSFAFTVADNRGGSTTKTLGASPLASSLALFTLPDANISSVTITSAEGQAEWGFAIDNVSFTTAAPEPASGLLIVLGSAALVFLTKLAKPALRVISSN